MIGNGQENGANCFKEWSRLVYDYSSLKLTLDDDILPALSGIAALYHRRFGGVYLAGMWKEALPCSLLWCRQMFLSQEDRPYLAPTWSWASSTANLLPDEFVLETLRSRHTKDIAYVKDAKCQAGEINPSEKITGGLLILEAPLLAVKIKLCDKHSRHGYMSFSIVSPPISRPEGETDWWNRLDYFVEERNCSAFDDDDFWLLSITIVSGWNHASELYGLLLRRSPGDPNSFERIARYKCYLRRRILWSQKWFFDIKFRTQNDS
jgi:hypothetical protein